MSLDRNAQTPVRIRRNWQKLQSGSGATGLVIVSAPLSNNGSTISLSLDPNGALEVSSSLLRIRLPASSGLTRDSTGLFIAPLGVTTARIADLAVTDGKLANSSVTETKIANSNVTTLKLANSSVTEVKIADLNVTTGKLANLAVTEAKIANLNVTTGKLADGSVTEVKIANLNVTTGKLANLAVTTGKLADDSVTEAKIVNLNVTTGKLADLAVTTGKLASNSVTTAKIADLNVTTGKLDDLAVTAAKLASNSVETAKIADLNVTTAKLADEAVTTVKIADLNVTAGKIANNAVTLGKLGALTTKGDVLAHDGSAHVRVPVGTNGHVLTADSTAAAGVSWQAAGSSSLTGGDGIDITGTTVSVDLATNPGLEFDTAKLRVRAGNGIERTAGGTAVRLRSSSGLDFSSAQLFLKAMRGEASDPGSPANGDWWFNTTDGRPKIKRAVGLTRSVGLISVSSDNSASVSNTSALTFFDTTNELLIPANSLRAGDVIRVRLAGRARNGTGTCTHIFAVYASTVPDGDLNQFNAGGTSFASSSTLNRPWLFDMTLVFPIVGTSGAVRGLGTYLGNTTQSVSNANTTINTTVDIRIRCSVTMSVADPTNVAQLQNLIAEVL